MLNVVDFPVVLPDLPEKHAPRNNFLHKLSRAADKQFVYIHSPAGYGKTVACLLRLKKTGQKAAWRSFDKYDDTPALFYMAFCMSLLSIIPEDRELARIVTAPDFRTAPVEYTIEILTKADYGRDRLVLVLDDFHNIKKHEILTSLPYVLKRLPSNIAIFFLSRKPAPPDFHVLRSSEKLAELGVESLVMSDSEVQAYLRIRDVSPADPVYGQAEGQLMLLNALIQDRDCVSGFFDSNIWSNLDDERRLFLVTTAIPETFSIELAGALTEIGNCREYINELICHGAYITFADDKYRYHPLFRDYLLGKSAEFSIVKTELNKKATLYYLKEDDAFNAHKYAVNSGTFDLFAESFKEMFIRRNFMLDDYCEFMRGFSQEPLPDAIYERFPFLYIAMVIFSSVAGDAAKFVYYSDKLKGSAEFLAQKFPQMDEIVKFCLSLDHRCKPNEVDPLQSPCLSASYHLPFLHRGAKESLEFVGKTFDNLLSSDTFKKPGNSNLFCYYMGVGGGLLIETNRIAQASDIFFKARGILNSDVDLEITFALYIGQAETALLSGKRDLYNFHLSEAKKFIVERNAGFFEKNLAAYEARLGLANGDVKVAEKRIADGFTTLDDRRGFGALYKIYRNLTTARALIVTGELQAALTALYEIERMARAFGRVLDAAEASALIAVADWVSGNKKAATQRLERELIFLQPYGFVRVIANEGKAILPIISAILRSSDAAKTPSLSAFIKTVQFAAIEQSKRFKGITGSLKPKNIRLSKQQAMILGYLARGLRNAEIAEAAAISLNTVRYHTKVLYRKLDVNSAHEAVLKAREMGVLG
ncbi:MAG: LuxR C-terminal-related transcriptional regulator [Oscillospiraceae bacterium]|nr:LuxR C-terminal-related transcriptional regulator [Oscillospiraceae bacterium]